MPAQAASSAFFVRQHVGAQTEPADFIVRHRQACLLSHNAQRQAVPGQRAVMAETRSCQNTHLEIHGRRPGRGVTRVPARSELPKRRADVAVQRGLIASKASAPHWAARDRRAGKRCGILRMKPWGGFGVRPDNIR
jgi:hypothetical protein